MESPMETETEVSAGESSSDEVEIEDDEELEKAEVAVAGSSASAIDKSDKFEKLMDKLRERRKKEIRHSEEKVSKLESLLEEQQAKIEDLKNVVRQLKAQEFSKRAKYAETSSASSISSEEDEESSDKEESSDFYDEGIESAPHTSAMEPSHPLLIDPILTKIMEHLPLKSLLQSRLVCRKWYRFAHKYVIRRSDPVILEIYYPWSPSRGKKLSNFLEEIKGSKEDCPFSKYVLRCFQNLSELEPFFRRFGPTIRQLDLNFPQKFSDNGEFRRVLFEYAPSLKSLRIGCCSMMEGDHFWEYSELELGSGKLSQLQTFHIGNIVNGITLNGDWIKEFLVMTPNLRHLVLQVDFKEDGKRFIQTVLETLLQLRSSLKSLKSIAVSSLHEEHLKKLIELGKEGMELENFRFADMSMISATEGERHVGRKTISNFLTSQSHCLEAFEVEKRSDRIRGFIIPVMSRLKKLTFLTDQDLSCGYLNYSKQFPALQSLTLRGYSGFSIPHYFSEIENIVPCRTLTQLSLPSGLRHEPFPAYLANLFPNVKGLEIRGASNEFLRSVWQAWPDLRDFKMVVSHHDENLDSGITGISNEEIDRIRLIQFSEFETVNLEEIRRGPAITDLTSLRHLEIECRAIWIPCQLVTDISAYFAFSKMKHLKVLKMTEIGVPESFDLSNQAIEKIYEDLPETELKFKVMSDHGRWQLELPEVEAMNNMYESEPLLEDHNKDRVYRYEKSL